MTKPLTIQQLRERRKDNAIQVHKLLDDHPEWNAECQSAYDELVQKIEVDDADIARRERVLAITAREIKSIDRRADQLGVGQDEAASIIAQEKEIFETWCRHGVEGLTEDQRRFMAQMRQRVRESGMLPRNQQLEGTPTAGGVLVPRTFMDVLIETLKAFGGIREVARVMQTSAGEPMDWPTTDATNEEGELVAEAAPVTDLDTAFDLKTLGAFKYSSKVVSVSLELLQDSAINLESYLPRLLATRIARITNKHFTIGTGVGQPEGVATVAASAGAIAATGPTYDDLVGLEHSVDPAYRSTPSCRWMFHDLTLKAMKLLKDDQQRPLWLPSVAGVAPATFLGYQYIINQAMIPTGTAGKTVLFGDFNYFIIRDVLAFLLFRMTDSVFITKGLIGFLGFTRHDSRMLDPNAVKALTGAAAGP